MSQETKQTPAPSPKPPRKRVRLRPNLAALVKLPIQESAGDSLPPLSEKVKPKRRSRSRQRKRPSLNVWAAREGTDIKEIAVDKVIRDRCTQVRIRHHKEVSESYAANMKMGCKFPPVVLYFDGTDYRIVDGHHRFEAAIALDLKTVMAEVREGTQRDAIIAACAANKANGLQMTRKDKWRAVTTLLRDSEWEAKSDRKIAEHCGVSGPFVAKVREAQADNGTPEGANVCTEPPKRTVAPVSIQFRVVEGDDSPRIKSKGARKLIATISVPDLSAFNEPVHVREALRRCLQEFLVMAFADDAVDAEADEDLADDSGDDAGSDA